MVPHFYHHPGTLNYNFGDKHPLKPERLRRALKLLQRLTDVEILTPDLASHEDLARCHAEDYIDAVQTIDQACQSETDGSDDILELRSQYGFFGDNPPFAGMYQASLAYCGASIQAAKAVRDGAPLAFGIGGGLHHALRSKASGFCLFDDPAIAVHILKEKFQRVTYVDIDVHHGDGVQWIWYDDPTVLTVSIHEEGRTLWPGIGGVEETGAHYSSLNIPLKAKTTADVWIHAFESVVPEALANFKTDAIVLQLGTDTHYLDPLGHLLNTQQSWLRAVRAIQDMGVPIVALGGGGYNLTTVPRMWVSAILTLSGIEFDDRIPGDLAEELEAETFSDHNYPHEPGGGADHARGVIDHLRAHHLPHLGLNPNLEEG